MHGRTLLKTICAPPHEATGDPAGGDAAPPSAKNIRIDWVTARRAEQHSHATAENGNGRVGRQA
jgi:hypothetical protein